MLATTNRDQTTRNRLIGLEEDTELGFRIKKFCTSFSCVIAQGMYSLLKVWTHVGEQKWY